MENETGIEHLLEVKLENRDDFLTVRETLTRIGISSYKQKKLYQSCHILHKRGKYYIVHFKELFKLDGKPTKIEENDIARRNTIANLLDEWGLLKLVDPNKSKDLVVPVREIKILPYSQKEDWVLETKYNIGSDRSK